MQNDMINLQELENDEKFQQLVELLKKPNIFSVLKLDRYEIRHSNFLAWLLNPTEKHGLGSLFLDLILGDLISNESNQDKGNFKWIKRESVNDIDLFIEFDNLVIAIENKFDSDEHSDQLTKYRKYIDLNYSHVSHQYFVFLTPSGKMPKSNDEYIVYSYQQLINRIKQLVNPNLNSRTLIYIEDYLQSVQASVMKTNPENLLASQLYSKYKDVIDFIKENENSDINFITHQFNSLLQKNVKDYIKGSEDYRFSRFTTQSIFSVIKPVATSKRVWKNKEPLLFEISLEKEENRAVFLVSVSDFNADLNNKLHELFSGSELICPNPNSEWKIYNNLSVHFDFQEYQNVDYIALKFDEIYKLALPTILKVEELILANKESLSSFNK